MRHYRRIAAILLTVSMTAGVIMPAAAGEITDEYDQTYAEVSVDDSYQEDGAYPAGESLQDLPPDIAQDGLSTGEITDPQTAAEGTVDEYADPQMPAEGTVDGYADLQMPAEGTVDGYVDPQIPAEGTADAGGELDVPAEDLAVEAADPQVPALTPDEPATDELLPEENLISDEPVTDSAAEEASLTEDAEGTESVEDVLEEEEAPSEDEELIEEEISDETEQQTGEENQADPEKIEESAPTSDTENDKVASVGATSQEPHWELIGKHYFWIQEDGTVLKKGGWRVLNGERYFLAYKSGRRWSGWLTTKGKTYYLDPETGILAVGKTKIGKYWYYFKEDGRIPGEMLTGLIAANGKKMFAKSKGKLVVGWRNVKGKKYYFNEEAEAVGGWQTIDGIKYFFDTKQFYIRKGWLKRGSKTYYLLKNGTPKTGTATIGGKKYYFRKSGTMYTGWKTIKNHRYYYGEDGAMLLGLGTVDGVTYLFHPTYGFVQTGWRTIDENRYFFGPDGAMVTGLATIDGQMYLFQEDGILITGRPAYKINGTYYRIGEDGAAVQLTKRVEILAAERLDALGWSLPAAFEWAASMTYYRGAPEDVPSGYSAAEFYAEYGFEHGYGHCYMMASVFYEMASMLGYRVKFLKGYVPSSRGGAATHGWVEIYYNGAWYVCDPNFTYNTGRSGYMINYGWSGTWRYVDYYVASTNF